MWICVNTLLGIPVFFVPNTLSAKNPYWGRGVAPRGGALESLSTRLYLKAPGVYIF
jgi:hypothetical protein